jgi:glycosyltransferase involved in cell wall biosynthesis
MKRLILYAPNVGVGGGLVLLRALLRDWPKHTPMTALLDQRGREVIEADETDCDIHWFSSSVSGRWSAERKLRALSSVEHLVFCFHSLPPILPNSAQIFCFVHSPHIVGLVSTKKLSAWVRVRSGIEKTIFRTFRHRVKRFFVQTPSMKTALAAVLGSPRQPIDVLPFVDPEKMPAERGSTDAYAFDFIYPSDGAEHKNHKALFRAWELLAAEGMFPKLALTLHPERDKRLKDEAHDLASVKGLKIDDLGQMPHDRLLQRYKEVRGLLFASYAETFGIPLIEAQAAGLPILAAEADFVRDVCRPTETFDPHSPVSIARAVRRFLGGEEPTIGLRSPGQFVVELLARETVSEQAKDRLHMQPER